MANTHVTLLQYGFYWPDSEALGPGHRFVLWTQGCHRRCYRCATPSLQRLVGGKSIDPNEMAMLIANTQDITGLTISGGEPMLQPVALTQMLITLQKLRPELTVILFTGYLLEDFESPASRGILPYIDLLIDGEYYDELNDSKGLRGSSNQRLNFLSERLLPWRQELSEGERKQELHMLGEYEMLTIGIKNNRKKINSYGSEQRS